VKEKTFRSGRYLAFVRSKACCFCHAPGPSDPHHFAGQKGMAIKVSDLYTVPVCRGCHDEWHQRGSIRSFSRGETLMVFWRACARLLAEWQEAQYSESERGNEEENAAK
jgi:hypothetical protein